MLILGIAASHNGSACLVDEGRVVVAVQEERLTRRKRERVGWGGSSHCVEYCLRAAGVSFADLDGVAVCSQVSADASLYALFRQHPELEKLKSRGRLTWIPHHLGHALGAFAQSGFPEAVALVVDGSGSPRRDVDRSAEAGLAASGRAQPMDTESISIYRITRSGIEPLWKTFSPRGRWVWSRSTGGGFGSLGGMYALASRVSFGDFTSAGKVMALASYGSPASPAGTLARVDRDGLRCFPPALAWSGHGVWPSDRAWHRMVAATVQNELEAALLSLLDLCRTLGGDGRSRLCFSGGVALNVVANARLRQSALFRDIYVPAACEDCGTSLGAAAMAHWTRTGVFPDFSGRHEFFGRPYASREILSSSGVVFRDLGTVAAAARDAAGRLARGELIGWFQGRSELGPRALGNRSILGDPRRAGLRSVLNRKKSREAFRPVAPVVLASSAHRWFPGAPTPLSRLMLDSFAVPASTARSIPEVVHVDGSARAETVTARFNPVLAELLSAFEDAAGIPVLANTSFNLGSEPIVETPLHAVASFRALGLDRLYVDRFRIDAGR